MDHSEEERIKKYYAWREQNVQIWKNINLASLLICQQLEYKIVKFLNKTNLDLKKSKILDIGCGKGWYLREFVQYGMLPKNCFGIDLINQRISEAQQLSPNMNFVCGNAEKIEFPDESFDLVSQFTCFSSILDMEMRKNIAIEIKRVLKPKGWIIWYDMNGNLKRDNYQGISIVGIKKLFSLGDGSFHKVTLHGRLAEILLKFCPAVAALIQEMKIFNNCVLAFIQKQ